MTRKAKGSVIPAILLHSSTNLYSNYLLSGDLLTGTLAANLTQIKTVLYWAVAIVLIVATKGRLGYGALVSSGKVPTAEKTAFAE